MILSMSLPVKKEVKNMGNLIDEIRCKTNLITFLRVVKYSKGLNPHDNQVYEKTKAEVRTLNEKLIKMNESQDESKKLALSQNI